MDITSICFAFGILFVMYHMLVAAISKYRKGTPEQEFRPIDVEYGPTGLAIDATREEFARYQIMQSEIVTCELSCLEATTHI